MRGIEAGLEATGLRAAVVIPARLGSSRFPRKVLARQTGKFLIQHVWEGVQGTPGVERVIIATDSEEVLAAARSFGAESKMTSSSHLSGTDRVAEVARDLPRNIDVVVNVQGDEPWIARGDVQSVVSLFDGAGGGPDRVVMTTLAVERTDEEGHRDPNNVKVVLGRDGRALYFSRAAIPSDGAGPSGGAGKVHAPAGPGDAFTWLHHVGIYGYLKSFLLEFTRMSPGVLELRERLEQLRAIENGFRIRVGITRNRCRGIDTPEEYERFIQEYRASLRSAAPAVSSGVEVKGKVGGAP